MRRKHKLALILLTFLLPLNAAWLFQNLITYSTHVTEAMENMPLGKLAAEHAMTFAYIATKAIFGGVILSLFTTGILSVAVCLIYITARHFIRLAKSI